jgi:hypothetical protein
VTTHSHATVITTAKVDCASNGFNSWTREHCATLADLEEFTARLRERGAKDDLVIPRAVQLSAEVLQP